MSSMNYDIHHKRLMNTCGTRWKGVESVTQHVSASVNLAQKHNTSKNTKGSTEHSLKILPESRMWSNRCFVSKFTRIVIDKRVRPVIFRDFLIDEMLEHQMQDKLTFIGDKQESMIINMAVSKNQQNTMKEKEKNQ